MDNNNKTPVFSSFQDKNYIKYLENTKRFTGKIINSNHTCSICLLELTNNNVCVTLCGHKFHTSCILQCVEKNCPLCRKNLLN